MDESLQCDESLDIGSDMRTGVNDADYQPPVNRLRTWRAGDRRV